MKRLFDILSGMIIARLICIGLTWLPGALFGPLYQSEDESTRNFKIFLVVFSGFVIAGGIKSNRLYKNN